MVWKGTVSKNTEYFHCQWHTYTCSLHCSYMEMSHRNSNIALAKGFYAEKMDFFQWKLHTISKSSLINISGFFCGVRSTFLQPYIAISLQNNLTDSPVSEANTKTDKRLESCFVISSKHSFSLISLYSR